MNTKQPECWSVDPQIRGLRVELSSGQSVIMAYHHFAFAEWNAGDTEETLKINFTTREFEVHGRLLRRIEAALQRMELASISAVTDKYQSLIGENQPFITSIHIIQVAHTSGDKGDNDIFP